MKFGLLFETQRPYQDNQVDENRLYKETLQQCVLADEIGLDSVWFVEHHFLTGFSASPCPEVLLGALSQITKNIRIGFGVSILPYHHPVRVAERVAMVDQLTDGRVEFGTGRSNAYEQTGLGVDPRDTREMWEESITMIPQIWQSEEFSWEGKFWNVPPRRVLPKPFQKPHPPIWLACTQPSSYELAAEKGIGVLLSAAAIPEILEEHVKAYHENIKKAKPVGAFVNEQFSVNIHAYCGEDNAQARELCAQSMKTFYGPDKPYTRDRIEIYEELLKSWGGVPDHLKSSFARWIKQSDGETQAVAAEQGINIDSGPAAARAAIGMLDADTLCDRGAILGGDPDSCIKIIKMFEDIGVDQLTMLMQTETVPHEQVIKSLELFAKHVLPAFRKPEAAKTGAAT
ncbi:MAG: LLM class flavin-dependent oxidoreductase [Chloroflexi bacterium]|nr:LLM class flavin-dependent oxidoreductase [Chloroflexota bacterium]